MAKKARKAPKKAVKKPPARKKTPASNMNAKPRHGEFMWNELMTRDEVRALEFFKKLLGWSHQDWPMGDGKAPYRVAKIGEKSVAGIMRMTEPEFPALVPTHWCGYIAVRDIDAAWKKIAELGGIHIHPPSVIPQVGRFCIFKDPTGAVLALMEPEGGVA